jgi:hypothetical protein
MFFEGGDNIAEHFHNAYNHLTETSREGQDNQKEEVITR